MAQSINNSTTLHIESIFELVNSPTYNSSTIPVLVKLIEEGVDDDLILEGVVRSLTNPKAKGIANRPLLDLFDRTSPESSSLRWAIGNALKQIVQESDRDRVMAIVRNRRNGYARQEFVGALGKVATSEIEEMLVTLLDDEEVAAHALESLQKLRSPLGLSKAEYLVVHSKRKAVRDEARRYLEKAATKATNKP